MHIHIHMVECYGPQQENLYTVKMVFERLNVDKYFIFPLEFWSQWLLLFYYNTLICTCSRVICTNVAGWCFEDNVVIFVFLLQVMVLVYIQEGTNLSFLNYPFLLINIVSFPKTITYDLFLFIIHLVEGEMAPPGIAPLLLHHQTQLLAVIHNIPTTFILSLAL